MTVSIDELEMVSGLPLLLNIDLSGMKTLDWISEYSMQIREVLDKNGAVLIRGLKFHGSKQFGKALETIFDSELIQYNYRSTPRTELRGNVYTATEYPANETIPQHNENAYSRQWPNRIGFLCMLPPKAGGATPISDSRQIFANIPETIVKKFEEKKIMYVRNYSDLDLPWSEVFQTSDKSVVEEYCQKNDLEYEWLEDNALRTKQINPAVVNHPRTHEKLWFNQAHLFHISNLGEEMRSTLIESLGKDLLPRNTYFGDGSEIPIDDLDRIRSVYEQHTKQFEWQKNDLLLLDNMMFTHGRTPYTGDRKVLTGMAQPNVR